MKRRLLISFIGFIIVSSPNVSAQTGNRVTSNFYEDSSPHIKGTSLVWQGQIRGDWEIFFHNVATGEGPVQITVNDYDDISPQTDGNYVVWLGFSRLNGEIFLYDISKGQTTRITDDSNIDSYPQISDGRVVWASHVVGDSVEPGEIFLYDIARGETEQLTNNTLDDSSPRINDKSVIWTQTDVTGITRLFVYDIVETTIQPVPDGFVWGDNPQNESDLTVLARYDGSDREIFLHRAALQVYEQITGNELEDTFPVISNGIIAWIGGKGQAAEIYTTGRGPSGGGGDTTGGTRAVGSTQVTGGSGGGSSCFVNTLAMSVGL
jgi:hypothetical protein